MKPWNKESLNMVIALFPIAICVFFIFITLYEYYDNGCKPWIAPIISLIPAVYGMIAWHKKYYNKEG